MPSSTAQAGKTGERQPGSPSQFEPQRRYGPAFVALLMAASYLLHMSSLRFGFVWDDHYFVVQNPHLSSWRYLPVYFTQHIWSHVSNVPGNLYRPLFLVWMRLNRMVSGLEPAGWHLTTVLMHVVVIGLVYLLARTLLRSQAAALFAGLLFAFHPVHVEAVAWVCGVAESLGAALFLGSFLSYLAQVRTSRRVWQICSLALFSFALLVKETSAALPLVILSYELTLGKSARGSAALLRDRLLEISKRIAPFLGLLGIYFIGRSLALGGLAHTGNNISLLASLRAWPWFLCRYALLLLWPINLGPLYDPVYITRWTDACFVVPILILLTSSGALWWWRKHTGSRFVLFCTLWFLMTLAPALAASSLASPSEQFHDRYLYLPSVAFVMLMGAVFRTLLQTRSSTARIAVPIAGALWCVILALATHNQLRYWENDRLLFERANTVAPRNELGITNLVNELMKTREYGRALRLSEGAIAFNPGSARAFGSAGAAAFYTGDYSAAERYYSRAIQIDPSQMRYFQYLGLTRIRMDNNAGAVQALTRALALAPQQAGLHYSLGSALAKLNRWHDASEQFRQELNLDSTNQTVIQALHDAEAHENLETRYDGPQ
jgi:tetratricopeptide (TPR) repeat protein